MFHPITRCRIPTVKKWYKSEIFIFNNSISIELISSIIDSQEYAKNISEVIWKCLKRYISISINVTCLEYLPFETYKFGKREYNLTKTCRS